eukprot:g16116.t1
MDWGAFAGASVGGFVLVLIGGILSHYAFKRYWKKKALLREDVESPPEAEVARRTAIAKGEALRLKDEEGLGAARRVLEEEKVAARKELQDAIQAREIDRLRRAIARGLALQLKPGELVEAQRILKELEKENHGDRDTNNKPLDQEEKKKKKPKKVTTQQEEPLAREPTESMEEVAEPPLVVPVLPHEGSRPASIIPSLRSFGFSIRSIASQLLWVDSCEVTIGCGSITERTEYDDERSRTTGAVVLPANLHTMHNCMQ